MGSFWTALNSVDGSEGAPATVWMFARWRFAAALAEGVRGGVTVMAVFAMGAARIQKFIKSTSVAAG
jgi:hypothetical protein